jgi:riboflavin synthase
MMFTGLVQATGTIEAIEPITSGSGTVHLVVRAPGLAAKLAVGDSIAVSGVCLTALTPDAESFHAELAVETVERTSLSQLKEGSVVNLELPTPAGAPLGGHIVQGHVDATGTLLGLEALAAGERSDWLLRIAVPAAVGRFVVEKGSIAIEGISLTIAKWFPEKSASGDTHSGAGELQVAIIPHTYHATNLHTLKPGSPINLEADVLMKLAVQNGLSTTSGQAEWGGDRFEVTVPYLISNGY